MFRAVGCLITGKPSGFRDRKDVRQNRTKPYEYLNHHVMKVQIGLLPITHSPPTEKLFRSEEDGSLLCTHPSTNLPPAFFQNTKILSTPSSSTPPFQMLPSPPPHTHTPAHSSTATVPGIPTQIPQLFKLLAPHTHIPPPIKEIKNSRSPLIGMMGGFGYLVVCNRREDEWEGGGRGGEC